MPLKHFCKYLIALTASFPLATSVSYAAITASGDYTPTYNGTDDPWDAGALVVGDTGIGTMDIDSLSSVDSFSTKIGNLVGSDGTVTVNGVGTTLNTITELVVGVAGTGALNIENGGVITSFDGLGASTLGRHANSDGTAHVTGAGSTWNNVGMTIAGEGTGSFNINNGGTVNTFSGSTIAYSTTATGTATVSGEDSIWIIGSDLTVGRSGSGILRIEDGGVVSNLSATIGDGNPFVPETGVGTVTVTGTGSAWKVRGLIRLGGYGHGTLNIEDGGTVNLNSILQFGFSQGSGTLNLSGGVLNLNGHTIGNSSLPGTSAFNFTGGTLIGADIVALEEPFIQQGGTFAPGVSIGQTEILDEYALNAGILEIELGGIGDPIDLVTASDDIDIGTLGTTLDLRALGSMTAGTYTIMESTGGTITGMFEEIEPFNLFGVNVTVQNTGTEITLTLDNDLIFADPNTDGFVGIDDLNIVLANWNQNVTVGDILAGDLNHDGFVGIDDLNAILGHWNQGTPPGIEALSNVPEPASMVLMLGLFGASHRRSSHRT